MTDRKERLEEEFELESESEAFSDYEHIAGVLSANYSLIADEVLSLVGSKQGIAIDIGCGLGDLTIEIASRFPDMQVIGVDISKTAIDAAAKKAKSRNVNFQAHDVHTLPFEDNSIDLIVSHGTLHHFKDISKIFTELYRVLKPNSLAYLVDLRRDAPTDIVKEIADNLPAAQSKGFINSILASYVPDELRNILKGLTIGDFEVLEQKFSREAVIKNKEKLRLSPMRNVSYNKLSQSVIIKKH